jgi:hypothetical protein
MLFLLQTEKIFFPNLKLFMINSTTVRVTKIKESVVAI